MRACRLVWMGVMACLLGVCMLLIGNTDGVQAARPTLHALCVLIGFQAVLLGLAIGAVGVAVREQKDE